MTDSDIAINVELDENKVPENISWFAKNGGSDEWKNSKAMFLSIFDKETKDTLRIDLWTKEMQVMEMDRFFFYMLKGLADSYHTATQNKELASQMQEFAQHFGKSTGQLKT